MAAKMNKCRKGIILGLVVVVGSVFLQSGGVDARIPEPDNIIYGVARDDAVTVTFEVKGEFVASYKMGDNPDAGDYYILRIPVDALEPAEQGSALPGDEGYIYFNDETVPAASITLGERGTIYRLDFGTTDDTDGDGLPDAWEQQIVDANPNDAITSIDDVLPGGDFDGDGESNLTEYANGTDPTSSMSAQRGDVQGDKQIDLADAIAALQVASGADVSGETITTDGDVNEDERIGMEEAFYIMQKVSGVRQ